MDQGTKGSERARGTHSLYGGRRRDMSGHRKKSASKGGTLTLCRAQWGGTGQDTKRKRASKEHSPPSSTKEGQVRTLKNVSERGALTSCRAEREGRVRTPGERREASERGILTRCCECRRRSRQDTERQKAREGHSLPVEDKGRDKSGL